MNRSRFPEILACLALALFCVSLAQANPVKREIIQISGGLYQFKNNFHHSVFLVTDEGILVADPINEEAAIWLKAELKKRFDKPIRYLVYSHDHADHIAGGEVFAEEGAIVIAHQQAKDNIIAENRPTAVPDITFTDKMVVELDGQLIHLRYLGLSHSNNMIVIHFPTQKTLFAVDFISIKRLPYKDLSDAYLPEWITAIKRAEHIDFDILAPGHGPLGNKADVHEHRQYLQSLYDEVLAASRAGLTLEEMKQAITLDDYKHLGQYAQWREMNIEGVYRQIRLHRRGN